MKTKKLQRKDVEKLLLDTKGKFFGVTFIKRTTGERREMNARLNVKKHLKGGERAYDPAEKQLVFVYEMQNGYRAIPLEGVLTITFKNIQYEVIG